MAGDVDAVRQLAAYMTGAEARQMADKLEAGIPMSTIRGALAPARRPRIVELLEASGLRGSPDALIAVLRAVEGAASQARTVTPVWTAPDNLAHAGQLTSSIHHYVDRARESVVCATFNLQSSSALWSSLGAAAKRTGVEVDIYMDTDAADANPAPWKPSTAEVAQVMAPARVYRTVAWQGAQVRTHAKFIAVDHQYLIVMSANFSKSAEQHNIELGLVVHDPIICNNVLDSLTALGLVFELVD